MSKNTEKQQVMKWASDKAAIKARIKKLKARQPQYRVEQLQQEAGGAGTRKDSFLYQHGGDDGKLSERDRKTYVILVEDYERKYAAWQEAVKARRKDRDELENLGRQLAENKFPLSMEKFDVKGVGPFLRRAVSHLMSEIKTGVDLLNKLRQKQKAFETELANSRYIEPELSEAELLKADADGHLSTIDERRQIEKKVASIENLIARTKTAIIAKEKEVDELQHKFADALTSAVEAYTNEGLRKSAAAVKALMEEDEAYHKEVTTVCNQLIARAGARPVDVFEFTGGTLPAATRIFPARPMDKAHINTKIEAALNPQEQPLI